MKRLVAILVLVVLSSFPAHAEIERLVSVDPLTEPRPDNIAISGALSTKTPEAKLSAHLKKRLGSMEAEDSIEVIVTLAGPNRLTAASLADDERVRVVASLAHRFADLADGLGITGLEALSQVPVVKATTSVGDLEALAMRPEVAAVEPVLEIKGARAEGTALIQANQLRNSFGGSGAGVTVAVVDSGVALHPELSGKITAGADLTTEGGDGTNDGAGHGTAVAGIIAGTAGVAPESSIWTLKVFDSAGSGTAWDILTALNTAYANRNNFGGLDIINMSLGFPDVRYSDFCDDQLPSEAQIVSLLWDAGIAIFSATGNEADKGAVTVPACMLKTIAVGAVHDANLGPYACDSTTAADKIACYSNSGNALDILAPASCATTTGLGGGYEQCFNGTSAATPYAAGVAAQILSIRPQTTPAELLEALFLTGRPRTDVNGITRNRINALQAYQYLASGSGGGDSVPCVQDAATACLQDGRFEVKISYNNNQGSGIAKVMSFGGQRAENKETAFYYFQKSTNFEMGIKVLNACIPLFGNKYWVFISGLTNQGWDVAVRDAETGAVKTYSNPNGQLSRTFSDTQAFDCQ